MPIVSPDADDHWCGECTRPSAVVRRVVLSVLMLCIASASAFADPWKTTIDVVLRKKPGEKQAAIAKLPAGTVVVIEQEEGRWLRVRVGKKVGYLTRTTVADTQPAPPPPPVTIPIPTTEPVVVKVTGPSNAWSADRRAAKTTTGLFLAVKAATADLVAEPRAGAAKMAVVKRGERLAVLDAADPAWLHVRDDEGHDAWVARQDVDNGTAGVAIGADETGGAITGRAATDPVRRLPRGKIASRVAAGIGYRSFGMDFTSDGTAGLANYLVSADALAANTEGDVTLAITPRIRLGLDGRVQVSTSAGSGIQYFGPSKTGGEIPFSTFAADVGARVGIVRRVFELSARGGFHYDTFLTRRVENAGRLPREQLLGLTLGARAEIVPPTSRVSVGVRLDVLALGSRDQTPGLEDGASSSAGAVWAGATMRIALRRHLSLVSAYDFGRASTSWSGMSIREPGVTKAHRVDSSQIVQVGISAEL
ncbi:MAG: hypothetical protein H6Q90_3759 [Deltaproteobacteria bacterium]|nr:hypothetical protein [Deltaproteobacteria bacterium]